LQQADLLELDKSSRVFSYLPFAAGIVEPMSLRVYLLHSEEFQRYYNCSTYAVEQIPIGERAHPAAGT